MRLVKDGPDIPDELIRQHEDGRVVFFCGAGISRSVGLPDFKELVDRIEKETGRVSNNATQKMKKEGRYELLLETWDKDPTTCDIRKVVKEVLTIGIREVASENSIHNALLTLSLTRKKDVHLVTTNFDNCFEKYRQEVGVQTSRYVAPLLPVPKVNSWNGIVYLHGAIENEESSDSLRNLVLTSGDFGRAYLTERWAIDFIVELFRNYTVCFVGYSLADTTIRYFIDALDADAKSGKSVNPAYLFIGERSHRRSAAFACLKHSKVVRCIQYSEANHHIALSKTLLRWAELYTNTIEQKTKIIQEYAKWQEPLPMQEIDFIKQLLWAISDKDGCEAKIFANLPEAPPLKWAWIFFSKHLADKSSNPVQLSILANGEECPCKRTIRLWEWLMRYFERQELVYLVLSQKGELHPYFRNMIVTKINEMTRKTVDAKDDSRRKIIRLWKFLLTNKLAIKAQFTNYYFEHSFRKTYNDETFDETECVVLREALKPKLLMSRHEIFTHGEGECFWYSLSWESYFVNSIRRAFSGVLSHENFLQSCEWALKEGFLLFNQINFDYAWGLNREIASIEDHSQNRYLSGVAELILLVRDAWLELSKRNPRVALKKFHEWISSEDVLFQRLALFVAKFHNIIPPCEWCHYLVTERRNFLWSVFHRREICRLLEETSNYLNQEDYLRLLEVVLEGEEQKLHRSDRYLDYDMWLLLKKIASSKKVLPDFAQTRLNELEETHPDFFLSKYKKEEFFMWFSTNEDEDYIDSIEFIQVPRTCGEITKWLKEDIKKKRKSSVLTEDDWVNVCRIAPEDVLNGIKNSCNMGVVNSSRICETLSVWSDGDLQDYGERLIRDCLLTCSNSSKSLRDVLESIAYWFDKVVIKTESRINLLFELIQQVRLLYAKTKVRKKHLCSYHDARTHMLGRLINALMRSLLVQQAELKGKGLPERYKKLFTEFCGENNVVCKYAIAVLASYTNALYDFDMEWTRKSLFPLFKSAQLRIRFNLAWSGLFNCSRINLIPLIDELKSDIFKFSKRKDIDDQIGKEYVCFLIEIIWNYPHGDKRMYQRVLSELSSPLLELCVELLMRAQAEWEGDNKQNPWEIKVKPFYDCILPKELSRWSSKMKKDSVELVLHTGNCFSDALISIKTFLQGEGWLESYEGTNLLHSLLNNIELGYTLTPIDVLDYVMIVVKNFNDDLLIKDKVVEILNWAKLMDSTIENDDRYKELLERCSVS